MTRHNRKFQIFANSILLLMTACVILPFLLLFMSSITEENMLIQNGYAFLPEKFSLSAYAYIWNQKGQIFRAYGITILVTAIGTFINIMLSSLLAYGLSLKELPGKTALTFYVFFTMLFNGGLVPTYLMYTGTFHIKNTLFALIVPNFLMSAMNVLLIRTFYQTSIPEALYEAAKIDGAGHLKIFSSIVVPLPLLRGDMENTFDLQGRIEANQPFGIIDPRYLAYLVEFLISDKAKYITGTLIPVTAGCN